MSQLSTPGSGFSSRTAADNNVYTALSLISFLMVLVAIIYVGFRAQTLFGTLLPPGGS